MTKIDIVSDSPKDAGKTFAGITIQTPAQYEQTTQRRRRRRSRSSGRSSVTATTPSTPLFSTPTPTPKTSVQDEMKKIDSSSLDVFAKEDAKRRLLGISSGLPTSMQPYTPISQTLLTPTAQKRATTSRSYSPALQSTRTPDYGTDYLPLTQTPVPITAPFTPKTGQQLTVTQPKPFTTTKPEDVYKSWVVGERYRKDLADIDKRTDLDSFQKEEAKRKLLGISSGFSAKQQAEQRKAELEKAQQENLKNQVIGYRPSTVVSDYDWKSQPLKSLDLYNDREARLRQKAIDGDRYAEASLRGMGQLVTNMPRSLVNEVISVATFVYTLGKIGVFAVNNPEETASFIASIDQKTLIEADKYARSELSRAGAEIGKRIEKQDPTLYTDLAAIVAVDYAIAKGSPLLIKPSRKYISSIIDFFKNRGVLLDTRTALNEVRKFIPAKEPRVDIPTQIRNLEEIPNPTRKQVEELTVLRKVEKVDDTIKKLDELIIDNNNIVDRITDPYTPPPRVGRTIKIDVPKINDDVIKLIDDIKKSPIKDIVKSENTRKQIRRLFTQKFPTPPVDRSRQLAKSPKRYTDKQIIDAFYTDGTLFRRIKQDLAKQGIILRTEPKKGFFIDLKTGKRYPNIEVLYIKKDKKIVPKKIPKPKQKFVRVPEQTPTLTKKELQRLAKDKLFREAVETEKFLSDMRKLSTKDYYRDLYKDKKGKQSFSESIQTFRTVVRNSKTKINKEITNFKTRKDYFVRKYYPTKSKQLFEPRKGKMKDFPKTDVTQHNRKVQQFEVELRSLRKLNVDVLRILQKIVTGSSQFRTLYKQDIDMLRKFVLYLDKKIVQLKDFVVPVPTDKTTPKPKPDDTIPIRPTPDRKISTPVTPKPKPDDTIRRPKTPKKPDDTIRRPKPPSLNFKLKPAPKKARVMVKSQLGALQFVIPNPKTKKREVVEIKTGLPYLEAKRIGREITDNLILASFTPVKYGETKKRLSLPKIDMSKFRPRKSKGKVRKFVEKSKYRLDKSLEKKQIQQAKQIKDLVSNKIKQVKREIEKQKAMKML